MKTGIRTEISFFCRFHIKPVIFFIGFFTIAAFFLLSASCFGIQQKNSHKEITLTLASYVPVGYPYLYAGQKIFVDLVNKRGKGVVQLNSYFSGTLLKGNLLLPGLQAGTTDLIFQTGAYLLGSYPIIGIQMLPVWKTVSESYKALKMGTPLYELQNQVLGEKNLFQLANSGLIPEFLWTRKKLVRTPGDMKGLKIRVAGIVEAKIIQAFGASPVTMPSAELPQSLQRGVIDGALINPWTAQGRGIEEFCEYMLVHPVSWISTPIYIMRDRWDSLSESVKRMLLDCASEWEIRYMSFPGIGIVNEEQLSNEVIPAYESRGMKAVYLTKKEVDAFDNAAKPVIKWWVKRVGEKIGNTALKYTGKSAAYAVQP